MRGLIKKIGRAYEYYLTHLGRSSRLKITGSFFSRAGERAVDRNPQTGLAEQANAFFHEPGGRVLLVGPEQMSGRSADWSIS